MRKFFKQKENNKIRNLGALVRKKKQQKKAEIWVHKQTIFCHECFVVFDY